MISGSRSSAPPQTLAELERLAASTHSKWRFGLFGLIVVSNLLGLALAALAWTNGAAAFLVIPAAFASPMIAGLYIAFCSFREYLNRRFFARDLGRPPKSRLPTSPFDD